MTAEIMVVEEAKEMVDKGEGEEEEVDMIGMERK